MQHCDDRSGITAPMRRYGVNKTTHQDTS